jgi:hypothetical protein
MLREEKRVLWRRGARECEIGLPMRKVRCGVFREVGLRGELPYW